MSRFKFLLIDEEVKDGNETRVDGPYCRDDANVDVCEDSIVESYYSKVLVDQVVNTEACEDDDVGTYNHFSFKIVNLEIVP